MCTAEYVAFYGGMLVMGLICYAADIIGGKIWDYYQKRKAEKAERAKC